MDNLKEFKELIQRYETVSLEEIRNALYEEKQGISDYSARKTLFHTTSEHMCTLCMAVNTPSDDPDEDMESGVDCSKCVWAFGLNRVLHNRGFCLKEDNCKTYHDMCYAMNEDEFLQACRNRALHMRKLLTKLNIDL